MKIYLVFIEDKYFERYYHLYADPSGMQTVTGPRCYTHTYICVCVCVCVLLYLSVRLSW